MRTSGLLRPKRPPRPPVSPKWAGRMVAREARRASPATTRIRPAFTWASSGRRRATSRISRFTASVMRGRGGTHPSISPPRPRHKPRDGCRGCRLWPRVGSTRMVPPMTGFVLGFLIAIPVVLGVVALRTLRQRNAEAAALAEQVRTLGGRLETVEEDLGRTALRADVAETVLLEKGLADEEDLEEARRYFEQHAAPRYVRERDGTLH